MRLLLHFARFGPYHRARLCALAEVLRPEGWEVIGLETASTDSTYAWDQTIPASPATEADGKIEIRTAFPNRVYEELSSPECRSGLIPVLEELAPDAIAVAGWGTVDARITLRWCRRKGVKAIIMSETREADGDRVWWKEKLKSVIIQGAHGALVGGIAHRDYLVKLGIPADRIRFGYNVVDNAYFASEAARWRAVGGGEAVSGGPLAVGGGEAVSPMPPYFLASNRFIERKNLGRLIEAYAQFCRLPIDFAALWTRCLPVPGTHLDSLDCPSPLRSDCQPPIDFASLRPSPLRSDCQPPTGPWPLVLLGDGPQRSQLISRCHELGLTVIESAPWELETSNLKPATAEGSVYFPGFRQIEELPRFYAHAGAFIHPALEEPWGLVINEAMACGLPVISGNNVGAAAELIEEGKNGWTFDSSSAEAITGAMARVAALSEEQCLAMGVASVEILKERCPTPAFGQGVANLLVGED
jgi:1,2-diacylglycerol 3-alpha-glucosyltransferase